MDKSGSRIAISIVIPCLNEAETIRQAVAQATRSVRCFTNTFEVIVADNGSTDGTLKLLRTLEQKQKVRIVRVPIRGYGAALHYGILRAKHPYVCYADADLSYHFGELKRFVPALRKNYDLILGSRISGLIEPGAMPWLHQYVGTPILSFLIRWWYGLPTSDSNSGMRVVRTSFYKKLRMRYSGMEWASELLIRTALANGAYHEVPIRFLPDKRRRLPHLKRWSDGWRHLKVIIFMRPAVLLVASAILLAISLLFAVQSLFTTIALWLLSEVLFFCYALIKKLVATFEGPNKISQAIDYLPVTQVGILVNILGLSSIFLISDRHLYSKYILVFQVVLYNLWWFFIEIINTDLVQQLKRSPRDIT